MADFFWFSEEQWARIAPLLPTNTRGVRRVDDRRVLSGIVHALQSGGPWTDCPCEVYGPNKTLYNRFSRWAVAQIPVASSQRRIGKKASLDDIAPFSLGAAPLTRILQPVSGVLTECWTLKDMASRGKELALGR